MKQVFWEVFQMIGTNLSRRRNDSSNGNPKAGAPHLTLGTISCMRLGPMLGWLLSGIHTEKLHRAA